VIVYFHTIVVTDFRRFVLTSFAPRPNKLSQARTFVGRWLKTS